MRRDNESTLDTVAAGASVAEAAEGVGDTLAGDGDTTASSMVWLVTKQRKSDRVLEFPVGGKIRGSPRVSSISACHKLPSTSLSLSWLS